MGNISLCFSACILALLCPFISPTPLERGSAGQAPQVEARDVVTVTKDVINSAVQSNPPFYDTQCQVGGCTFDYESVSLFYYPSVAPNTACLSTLPSPPIETPPPGLLMESQSVYVIFTSLYIYDGCGTKLLEVGADITTSFDPDQLSTVATAPDGALTTDVFNFANLPCPPPGDDVPAGQPYSPLLAPPPFITAIPGWNPNFDSCDPGHGIDPPTAVTTVLGGVPGPLDPGMQLPPRDVRGAHPLVVPRGPTKTAGTA